MSAWDAADSQFGPVISRRPTCQSTQTTARKGSVVTEHPVLLVTAAALIDVDGRVLLARRPSGKSMAGLWEFPGGKVQGW